MKHLLPLTHAGSNSHWLFALFLTFSLSHLLTFNASGQNLVPNPSFEQFNPCPDQQDQVDRAIGWANFGDSPDYFNSCTFTADFSVPSNWGGYQPAASGNAYCAFGTYVSHLYAFDIRDIIGGQLSVPLTINTKYYVSFKVALSLSNYILSNCASNNIGAMFSMVPYTWNNPPPLTNSPHINTTSIITDTINWTRVFGSFTADSAYQYIIIGNFFDDNNTDTLIMDGDVYCHYSYYYLDDICVSTDSLLCANYVGIKNEPLQNDGFGIYPNPVQTHFYIENKVGKTYNVEVYNALGQLEYFKENISEKQIKIDIEAIKPQLFLLRITTKEKSFSYKLQKL